MFGVPGRHPGLRPDFETTLARLESVLDRLGAGGAKIKGQEVSVIPGGDSVPGPYSIAVPQVRK